jgi:aspartate-semialdehyde dehydrogenase
VAEVNPQAVRTIAKEIVANPSCMSMAAMPALKPLRASPPRERGEPSGGYNEPKLSLD